MYIYLLLDITESSIFKLTAKEKCYSVDNCKTLATVTVKSLCLAVYIFLQLSNKSAKVCSNLAYPYFPNVLAPSSFSDFAYLIDLDVYVVQVQVLL